MFANVPISGLKPLLIDKGGEKKCKKSKATIKDIIARRATKKVLIFGAFESSIMKDLITDYKVRINRKTSA
ncbi:MAG: hypothetical protein ACYSSP_11940 [Planctomycetota bacterium]